MPKRKKPPLDQPLTEKEERFVDEYLRDFHGPRAALRSGYPRMNVSQDSTRLLGDERIIRRIQERQRELQESCDIDAKWLIERYMRLADYNIKDLYNEDGTIKNVHVLPDELAYCIESVDSKLLLGQKQEEDIKDRVRKRDNHTCQMPECPCKRQKHPIP